MSPDGQQLAFSSLATRPNSRTISGVIELATGRATPLTDDDAGDYDPTWSTDGKYIVFNSGPAGRPESVSARLRC